jgi:uncharacterized protein YjdB
VAAEPRSRRGAALERVVLWSSSEPGVATVSERGEVRAHREGMASILAHCEGVGAAATITVVPAKVVAVRMAGAPESLRIGQSVRLIADARDARGDRLLRDIAFTTSDAQVARVASDGTVSALAEGRVTVTAICETQSAAVEIAVVPVPVDRIELSAPPSELVTGDTFHLIATTFDADRHDLRRAVEWLVDDARVLDALGGGRFRAAGAGRAVVTARTGDTESRVTLNVDPVRLASIVVSAPAEALDQDASMQLSAELRDQRGRPVQRTVQWNTSDAFIARINPRGVLLGVGAGTVTVTAACEGVSDSVLVTVNAAPWATLVMRTDATTGPQRKSDERQEPVIAAPEGTTSSRATPSPPRTADRAAASSTAVPPVPPVAPPAPPARQPVRHDAVVPGERTTAAALKSTPPGPQRQPVATGASPAPWRARLVWIVPLAVVIGGAGVWAALNGGGDEAEPPALTGGDVVAGISILDATTRAPAPTAIELTPGDTLRLSALAAREDGNTIADAVIDWSSTDASLATVDAGLVIARAAGAVRIAASAGNVRNDIALTIAERATTADASNVIAPPVTRGGAAPPQQQTRPQRQAEPPTRQRQTDPPAGQRQTDPPAGQRAGVVDSTPPAQPQPDGFLVLIIVPYADVYVDGELKARQIGRPPRIPLRPGTHELRLEHPDSTITRSVEIRPGENTQLQFTMRAR